MAGKISFRRAAAIERRFGNPARQPGIGHFTPQFRPRRLHARKIEAAQRSGGFERRAETAAGHDADHLLRRIQHKRPLTGGAPGFEQQPGQHMALLPVQQRLPPRKAARIVEPDKIAEPGVERRKLRRQLAPAGRIPHLEPQRIKRAETGRHDRLRFEQQVPELIRIFEIEQQPESLLAGRSGAGGDRPESVDFDRAAAAVFRQGTGRERFEHLPRLRPLEPEAGQKRRQLLNFGIPSGDMGGNPLQVAGCAAGIGNQQKIVLGHPEHQHERKNAACFGKHEIPAAAPDSRSAAGRANSVSSAGAASFPATRSFP